MHGVAVQKFGRLFPMTQQPERRTECSERHYLHDAILDAFQWRAVHDQHTLFIYIDEKHRGNHTPATWYMAIREAIEVMWCRGDIKPTPSAGYFCLSSCTRYDDDMAKRPRSRPRLVR